MKLRIFLGGATALWMLVFIGGCSWRPTADKHKLVDATFGQRHTGQFPKDSVLALAAEVTQVEDEIRRNGTITVKAPDVWGDANLMSAIQEYETQMKGEIGNFEETLSAYLARSDQADLQAATGIALGVGGASGSAAAVPPMTQQQVTALLPAVGEGEGANIPDILPAKLLDSFIKTIPASTTSVGIEPTELLRQHSTYIGVNQALRRRNMGDDRSRQAGYGLYKIRVPVSILPGRQTHQGYAAVVNMRARLQIDAAHLKYTFPKLVIADVVDNFVDPIFDRWDDLAAADQQQKKAQADLGNAVRACLPPAAANITDQHINNAVQSALQTARGLQSPAAQLDSIVSGITSNLTPGNSPLTNSFTQNLKNCLNSTKAAEAAGFIVGEQDTKLDSTKRMFAPTPMDLGGTQLQNAYGETSINALAMFVVAEFKDGKPKRAEIRQFLFDELSQRYEVVRRLERFSAPNPCQGAPYLIAEAADQLARGCKTELLRNEWIVGTFACGDDKADIDWIIAVQAGVLDHNIKRMIEELQLQGKIGEADAQLAQVVFFFNDPTSNQEDIVRLWDTIIQEAFPVHVFALDPQVEEQNAYDAFSRRREMQIALAISVAGGGWNAAQKVDMSRQLALDMAAIDLNRTAVAFSHDNDTFGWYFYPRIQSPPTEKSNIAALGRLIWSSGPTEHYDRKHLQIEPGIRDCEVLIAMPSFVPRLEIDVTTNWERLTNPGATKQSYEEMVALGGRVHRLHCNLCSANDEQCFRPGDYQRLISRVEQLEKMLSLQTFEVDLPFEYEQSGLALFDRGNVQLRPELHDFYGLEYVTTDVTEGVATYFFLRGRNFHPTLTHVIIGGAKSDSYAPTTEPDIQVISRELIRVKVNRLDPNLSEDGMFTVRCGTPTGISNPLQISRRLPATVAASVPDFRLRDPAWLSGSAKFDHTANPMNTSAIHIMFNSPPVNTTFSVIKYNKDNPLPIGNQYDVITHWTFNTQTASQKIVTMPINAFHQGAGEIQVDLAALQGEIYRALQAAPLGRDYDTAKGQLLVRIGDWPYIAVDGALTLKFYHE